MPARGKAPFFDRRWLSTQVYPRLLSSRPRRVWPCPSHLPTLSVRPWWISHTAKTWLEGLQLLVSAVAAGFGYSLQASQDEIVSWAAFSPIAGSTLRALQRDAWWVVPLCIAMLWILELLRRRVGNPVIWEGVDSFLDQFRNHVFEDAIATANPHPSHHFRATLFRRQRFTSRSVTWSGWRPHMLGNPWKGWLVPMARSGHLTQKTRTVFAIPDDGRCEGLAGWAWASDGPVSVTGLPNVSAEDGNHPTEPQFRQYASKTRVSVEWVKIKRPTSRAMWASPVEVDGKPAGVLVIDSRHPSLDGGKANRMFKETAEVLGTLLKGA